MLRNIVVWQRILLIQTSFAVSLKSILRQMYAISAYEKGLKGHHN